MSDEATLARHTETELKLAIAPDHLDAVSRSPVVTARRFGAPVLSPLVSTYFDTADRRLGAQKAVLRVRQTPDGFIQTLKAGEGLTRSEWETPVAGLAVDLTAFTEPAALAALAGLPATDLEPMFETRIERTTILLDQGRIELAIDHGEIATADGGREPVSEIELELKDGEPGDLYRLALVLAETLPLTIEPRTKAARGFALASQELPRPIKSQRVVFEPGTCVDSAMATIFGSCFDQFAANLPCVLAGTDPEGVHQARVALRRLRSALSLFRRLIPVADHQWLSTETKWLAGALGPARDWDVFLADLLAPVKGAFAFHPELYADLAALDEAARERRRHAYEAVREAVLSPRLTVLSLRFGEWLERRGWRNQPVTPASAVLFRPLRETAEKLLDRRHRRARKTGGNFGELSYIERHQLRISLKKLRYAVEFFRSLHEEKPVVRYAHQLSSFQDILGHLNDVATAARLVPTLSAASTADALSRAVGVVIGWHGRGLAAQEHRLIAEWHEFRTTKAFWSRPAG